MAVSFEHLVAHVTFAWQYMCPVVNVSSSACIYLDARIPLQGLLEAQLLALVVQGLQLCMGAERGGEVLFA